MFSEFRLFPRRLFFGLKAAYDSCCPMQSAYNGRGDRADPSTWPEVEAPLTVTEISS